jgi:hypothetical protein
MGAVGSDGYGRIAIRNREDGARTLTPHQVGARLGYGPIPAGATVLHDCQVRLCCRAAPGHLQVGTQSENMRQAVARPSAGGSHGLSKIPWPTEPVVPVWIARCPPPRTAIEEGKW